MSVLDDWLEKGRETVARRSPQWIEEAVKKARKLLPEEDSELKRAARTQGNLALDGILERKDLLARFNSDGLKAFLALVGMGRLDMAAHEYLRKSAGWGEIHAAMDAAGDGTVQAKRDYDNAVAFAEDLGRETATLGLNLLIGVL